MLDCGGVGSGMGVLEPAAEAFVQHEHEARILQHGPGRARRHLGQRGAQLQAHRPHRGSGPSVTRLRPRPAELAPEEAIRQRANERPLTVVHRAAVAALDVLVARVAGVDAVVLGRGHEERARVAHAGLRVVVPRTERLRLRRAELVP